MVIFSYQCNILNIFFLCGSWLAQSLDVITKSHSWLDCGHWSSDHEMKGPGSWVWSPFLLKPRVPAEGVHLLYSSYYNLSLLTIAKTPYLCFCSERSSLRVWSFFLRFLLNQWDTTFYLQSPKAEPSYNRQGRKKSSVSFCFLRANNHSFAHNVNWWLTKNEVLNDCSIWGFVFSSSHSFYMKQTFSGHFH